MKDQAYQIISFIAIAASFIPIALVVLKKLWREPPFLLIAIYWMLSGCINLVDKIPGISSKSLELVTIIYNMLDIPIILWIIYFTTTTLPVKKFTSLAAPILLIAQLLNFFIKGWNYDAAKYVLAAGLLSVLVTVVWEISMYMHKLEHTKHEKAMVFIHVSLLFAYGTFIMVYIFDYYINVSTSSVANLTIYYISTFIAIIIASIGYFEKASRRNFI